MLVSWILKTIVHLQKIYPFADEDNYNGYNAELSNSSQQRRTEHSLPLVEQAGNIFNADLLTYLEEYFPNKDECWVYMNNEADVDMVEFNFKPKNKFSRSPTELFTNPKQQVAYQLVTKVGNSTGEIK